MMGFKNKTVWVTGASSGIGKALAIQFSKLGANVVLSSRKESDLKEVEKLCQANTLVLPLGDSTYIFVEVTIDPNGQNLPLVVEDRILFNTNGNEYQVILNAWGQDAYFHVNELVEGQWLNDKPHVIYGVAAVGFPNLDSGKTLSIDPGTTIHGHANSSQTFHESYYH